MVLLTFTPSLPKSQFYCCRWVWWCTCTSSLFYNSDLTLSSQSKWKPLVVSFPKQDLLKMNQNQNQNLGSSANKYCWTVTLPSVTKKMSQVLKIRYTSMLSRPTEAFSELPLLSAGWHHLSVPSKTVTNHWWKINLFYLVTRMWLRFSKV